MTELTQGRLKELLLYDPETGVLTWLVDVMTGRDYKQFAVRRGDIAGYTNARKYVAVKVEGNLYLAHRLAWLYVTGVWPELDIDHRDNNRTNNRWSNLREVNRSTNLENQTKPHRDSKSGFLGVSRCGSKWQARVWVRGVRRNLGYFGTPEEAHQAYLTAKRVMHAGCTI